jgi:16S rRNA C967 or C1407 C5-methylase (RsmB/RsmF family)
MFIRSCCTTKTTSRSNAWAQDRSRTRGAPCSGFGTLRRNPDLKWRQTRAAIEELTVKQQAILTAAAALVKPGGRLVYATCSFLRAENQDIVAAFLTAHPDFVLRPASEVLAQQYIPLDTGDYLQLYLIAMVATVFLRLCCRAKKKSP